MSNSYQNGWNKKYIKNWFKQKQHKTQTKQKTQQQKEIYKILTLCYTDIGLSMRGFVLV